MAGIFGGYEEPVTPKKAPAPQTPQTNGANTQTPDSAQSRKPHHNTKSSLFGDYQAEPMESESRAASNATPQRPETAQSCTPQHSTKSSLFGDHQAEPMESESRAATNATPQRPETAQSCTPQHSTKSLLFGESAAEPMKSESQRANEIMAAQTPVNSPQQDDYRPSTRVRAPPGGACSNIFG